MSRARLLAIVLLALCVGTSSCFLPGLPKRKTTRVFVPPPVHREPVPDTPAVVDASAAPQLDAKIYDIPELPQAVIPTIPPPPEPPKRAPVAPVTRITATPPAPPETIPAPRLGQIYTGDQLRDYTRTLDESLDRVRKALGLVSGKNLSFQQLETVERIRTFQRQAEQAREQDLVTAVSLARRADVLAQDLLQRLP